MVKLKKEFNELITHPYMKEDTIENKKDFGDKLYKFFFYVRDVANRIGNKDVVSAVDCGMHDWCKCARMIQYDINNHLSIQQKFNAAAYLNIVFREIAHFISCGRFDTITKNLTHFYVQEFPAYPKYKYCKPLEKWKLYLTKKEAKELYESLKNKFEGKNDYQFLINEFEDYYNKYDEYWKNEK